MLDNVTGSVSRSKPINEANAIGLSYIRFILIREKP